MIRQTHMWMSPITPAPVRRRPRWSVEVLLLGCHRGSAIQRGKTRPRNDGGARALSAGPADWFSEVADVA